MWQLIKMGHSNMINNIITRKILNNVIDPWDVCTPIPIHEFENKKLDGNIMLLHFIIILLHDFR